MKIRIGFVSNSSSSSFVIKLEDLTGKQVSLIRNHIFLAKDDPWTITETKETISGFTSMDNFDMRNYLSEIGIKDKDIDWGDSYEWR